MELRNGAKHPDHDATQRIDAALDLVLRAAGSSIAKCPGNLYEMRNAMRKIMGDEYIRGSNDRYKAMMENIKNVWLADELSAGAAPTGGEA